MLDKILQFLDKYLVDIQELIKKHGKYRIVSAGLTKLINEKHYEYDELRKELSIFTKRIISEREFNQILDKDTIIYSAIIHER